MRIEFRRVKVQIPPSSLEYAIYAYSSFEYNYPIQSTQNLLFSGREKTGLNNIFVLYFCQTRKSVSNFIQGPIL